MVHHINHYKYFVFLFFSQYIWICGVGKPGPNYLHGEGKLDLIEYENEYPFSCPSMTGGWDKLFIES